MRLLQIVQAQIPLLEQILRLSEKQLNIVQLSNMELLIPLLAQKQKVYEMFEELRQQLKPYQNIEPQNRKWESEQERLDCEAAIQKSKELIAAILELERQCHAEMTRQRDDTKRQLQKIGASGKAATAYAKQDIKPVSTKTVSSTRIDFTE